MAISAYSVTMAILWFSLAALIGSVTLRRITRGGVLYVAVIFLLALVRGLMPYEFSKSIIIRSKTWYPFLQDLVRFRLFRALTLGHVLLGLWLAGAVILVFLTCRKLFLLNRFRRTAQAEPFSGELAELAREVAGEFRYCGPVTVHVSSSAATAYQAGFLRPFIILPSNIDDFTAEEIRSMLRHELSHFLGRDLWIKCTVQLLTCSLWWNPAAAMLNAGIGQMLELRCDKRVCASLSPAGQLAYLETLLHLAKMNSMAANPIAPGYTGSNEEARIVQRFQLIRTGGPARRYGFRMVLSLILSVILFWGSYAVILQPWTDISAAERSDSASLASAGNYIIYTADHKYVLYIDGNYGCVLNEALLTQKPFCEYTIYEGGYPNEETPHTDR